MKQNRRFGVDLSFNPDKSTTELNSVNLPAASPTRSIAILAALVIGSLLLLVSFTLPEGNRTWSAIQNFGHFMLFVFLGWVALPIVDGFMRNRIGLSVLLTGTALILLGIGVELIQTGLVNRSASLSDLVLDMLGIVVGFLLYFLVRFYKSGKNSGAVAIGILLVFLTGVAVRPLVPLIGFDLLRAGLPVVRGFDHLFAGQKIEPIGGATFEPVSGSFATGNPADCCSLRVTFNPARYSGVIFEEDSSMRARNWSDFEVLNIKIFSSLRNTRQITLRINDRLHNNRFEDRYNSPLSISPGLNEIALPLKQITTMGREGASSRLMDIDDVTRIQIFARQVENPFTLDILSIELK